MNKQPIAFFGLGKLGMDCAEVFAEHYNVVGYDINPVSSDTVRQTTIEETVNHSEWIFIAVPTPHEKEYDGSVPSMHLPVKDFDYDAVKTVLSWINKNAHGAKKIVLISTVLPGTVRSQLTPMTNRMHTIIYNPYLIAMGTTKWDFVNPEMVIMGTENGAPTDVTDLMKLHAIYKPMMQNNPRYEMGTWEEAEAIKIFYNTYISAKIGIVNMIQDFAMKIGNMNVDVVTNALAHSDIRLQSPKYMTAGMGDSGACHPRDNIALRWLAKEYDLGYDMFQTIMGAREIQAKNLADYLVGIAKATDLPILIHGKAYKPDVEYTIGSYSTLIGHYIADQGITPQYVDPLTGDKLDTFKGVILLAHNRKITYGYAGNTEDDPFYCTIEEGSIVVDPWRMQPDIAGIKVLHYGNTREI